MGCPPRLAPSPRRLPARTAVANAQCNIGTVEQLEEPPAAKLTDRVVVQTQLDPWVSAGCAEKCRRDAALGRWLVGIRSIYAEDSPTYILRLMKTLVDIDEASLAEAQRELQTSTKKDTINQALAAVAAAGARRRDLERLRKGGLPDLGDPAVMTSAWLR